MKNKVLYLLLLFSFFACKEKKKESANPQPLEEIWATDISFYPEINAADFAYRDENNYPTNFFLLLKSKNVNTVRIRLWHDDFHPSSSLVKVAQLAREAKSHGLKVWLNFHYSDTWADPGAQAIPKAWENLSYEALIDTVKQFTAYALSTIPADYVQIGNEINGGFMWPQGKIDQLPKFLGLYRGALATTRSLAPNAKVILHFAGINGSSWFYNQFSPTDYDIAGISYYPTWHGKDLGLLGSTLNSLNKQTGKPVMIAETSYPFTLGWNDYTNNVIGDTSQIIPNYAPTPAGQAAYLKRIQQITKENGGIGVGYWGTEWVAYKGDTSTQGSSWENQAWFNFNGAMLEISF